MKQVSPRPEFQPNLRQLRGQRALAEGDTRDRRRPRLIGSNWAPSDRVLVGVGLFPVPKIDRNDPNRHQPLRDWRGKTTSTAAVGLSLRF